jgi:hypothetical protein
MFVDLRKLIISKDSLRYSLNQSEKIMFFEKNISDDSKNKFLDELV